MKKILLALIAIFTLGFSTLAFASTGRDIDAQEKVVEKFLASTRYNTIRTDLAPGLRERFGEKEYVELFSDLSKNLGRLEDKEMMVYQRLAEGNVLLYALKYEKGIMRLVTTFRPEGKTWVIDGFTFEAPQAPEQEQQKK